MSTKAHQPATGSPKTEVGEIDTRAPFESVKAAVSLFGEVAFSADKSALRKPKVPQAERVLAKETELHLAQKELNKYKERLNNAETTRIQALAELEKAKKTVEDLTNKFNAINKSKELAIQATEAAKSQTKELEGANSNGDIGKDGSLKQELDTVREQYAGVLVELDAEKQKLRKLKNDFETSWDAKLSAIQKESEAMQASEANKLRASQLSEEIAAVQESHAHVKLATEQAHQEESKILSEKEVAKKVHKETLEKTEMNLASLRNDFDPATYKSLQEKLNETTAEIAAAQKKMEDARASDLASVAAVSTELDDAKEMLSKVAEEESNLRNLVESLKSELEGVKEEHTQLKQRDAETESIVGDLHIKLQKCKAELEAAVAAEAKATSSSDDLMLALQQLSSESKSALEEAEVMKKSAEDLRNEAEAARVALADAEEKLQVALKDAEEAKEAEAQALDQIKQLSERTNAARASISESGAKITISKDEFESLSHKVEESEKLSEMKVAAAMAQVEAVRASENEAIKKLEAARKEMEDMEIATEEALKRAEMAETAKKAVEGELKKWREMEQKKNAEPAPVIRSETQSPVTASPSRLLSLGGKTADKTDKSDGRNKISKTVSKKTVLPNLTSIFQRKKSHADSGSSSYLPSEGPA